MKHSYIENTMVAGNEVYSAYQAIVGQFGSLVRQLISARRAAKLTQAELAARMHTTQSPIARFESGAHVPSASTVVRYAAACGLGTNITVAKAEASSAAKRLTAG